MGEAFRYGLGENRSARPAWVRRQFEGGEVERWNPAVSRLLPLFMLQLLGPGVQTVLGRPVVEAVQLELVNGQVVTIRARRARP